MAEASAPETNPAPKPEAEARLTHDVLLTSSSTTSTTSTTTQVDSVNLERARKCPTTFRTPTATKEKRTSLEPAVGTLRETTTMHQEEQLPLAVAAKTSTTPAPTSSSTPSTMTFV